MANNYITTADIQAYMPTDAVATSHTWDTLLATLPTNLSRAFDSLTWREPGAYAVTALVTRPYDGIPTTSTDYIDLLQVDEMADAPSTVQINTLNSPTTVSPSDYWLYNGYNRRTPYSYPPWTHLKLNPKGVTKNWGSDPHSISVQGYFGYSRTVPADIFEAMLLFAVEMIRKAQQNYQETGTLIDMTQLLQGMKGDDWLSVLIERYKKPRL